MNISTQNHMARPDWSGTTSRTGPDEVYDEFDNGRSDNGPDAIVDEFDNSRSRQDSSGFSGYDSYSGGSDYIGGMFIG